MTAVNPGILMSMCVIVLHIRELQHSGSVDMQIHTLQYIRLNKSLNSLPVAGIVPTSISYPQHLKEAD